MELLDMVPADAIALRLCSLPAAAGSLWAWLVAALAAAVGLWRIRAATSASNSSRPGAGAVRSVSALVDDDKLHQEQKAPLAPSPAAATDDETRPAAQAAESEPSKPSKVRFTAYYGGSGHDNDGDGVVDGVRKCGGADDEDEEEDGARRRGVETTVLRRTASDPGRRRATALSSWDEEREMAVRRSSDLGWYRHIDLAALDGSVVRLWDGELTAASPRGRRRTRAGLEFQLSL